MEQSQVQATGKQSSGAALSLGGSSAKYSCNYKSLRRLADLYKPYSNLTGSTPSALVNGNLTLSASSPSVSLVMTSGDLTMNGNLSLSSGTSLFTLTSGKVYMGDNLVTYSNASGTTGSMGSGTGSFNSYFAFLGKFRRIPMEYE